MTALHPRKLVRLAAITLLLSGTAVPAWSQEEEFRLPGAAKEGGYVGMSFLPQFTLDGITFDGETAYKYEGGEELVFLPRVDTRKMFRGILGYRARRGAIEVSYERTKHIGSFFEFPLNATFQAVNVDGRVFFLPGSRVQPHLLLGGVYPMLNVIEGSFLPKDQTFLEGDIGDARFNGYGINTEAGVTIYPVRELGISVGYGYRSLWFDRVRGVSDKVGKLKPKFREASSSIVVTANFILP